MAQYFGFEPVSAPPYYFVSYHTPEAGRIGPVAMELHRRGVPLWYDNGLVAGEKWEKQIVVKVRDCQAVILFVTKKLMAQRSPLVKKEFMLARKYNKPIHVVMLDPLTFDDVNEELQGWFVDLEELHGTYPPHGADEKTVVDMMDDNIHFIKTQQHKVTFFDKIKLVLRLHPAVPIALAAIAVTAAVLAVLLPRLTNGAQTAAPMVGEVSETDQPSDAQTSEEEEIRQRIASYRASDYDNASRYTYSVNEDGLTVTVTGLTDKTLQKIKIPPVMDDKLVTALGADCFSDETALENVIIPDSVTAVGQNAFAHCENMSSITIPDSVVTIGDYAFERCYGLKSIVLPDGIESIGEFAFSTCNELRTVTVSQNLKTVSNGMFSKCMMLQTVTLYDGVTAIEDYAFLGCTSLKSITIPDSVTEIGDNAFSGISGITIQAPSGSYAQTYAKSHGITFQSVYTQ